MTDWHRVDGLAPCSKNTEVHLMIRAAIALAACLVLAACGGIPLVPLI